MVEFWFKEFFCEGIDLYDCMCWLFDNCRSFLFCKIIILWVNKCCEKVFVFFININNKLYKIVFIFIIFNLFYWLVFSSI